MAIVLESRPTTPSAFVALGNPVIYRFTRKDHTFNQINNSGGFVQLQFNSTDLTASFSDNDILWVKSNNGVYNSAGIVTAVSFSTNTLVTTNIAYVSAAPGGYVNNNTKRSNYKLEVELWDTVNILDTSFNFSPDKEGNLIVDVSFIKSILTGENVFTYSEPTTSRFAVAYPDANRYIRFGIRYREVWLGSSNSQTDDTSTFTTNIVSGVLGSNQINPGGNGGNLVSYTGTNKEFLTLVKDKKIKISTPISFLSQTQGSNISNYLLYNLGFASVGTALGDSNINSLIDARLQTSLLKRIRFGTQSVGTGTAWTIVTSNNANFIRHIGAATTSTDRHVIPLIGLSTGTISVRYRLVVGNYRGSGGGLVFSLRDSSDTEISFLAVPYNGDSVQTGTINLSITSSVRALTLRSTVGNGVGSGDQVTDLDLVEFSTGQTDYSINTSTLEISGGTFAYTTTSEVINIEVDEPCKNDVTLLWKNSLGGLEQHTFPYNQEIEYVNDQGRRFKEMLLFDQDLNIEQWEAFNELMYPKEPFKNNYTELTSTTYKTDSVDNQQVYLVRSDLTKIGVIVIPQTNTTRTKRSKHDIGIRIRLPEYYL